MKDMLMALIVIGIIFGAAILMAWIGSRPVRKGKAHSKRKRRKKYTQLRQHLAKVKQDKGSRSTWR